MDDNNRHPTDERKIKFRSNIMSSPRENIQWILFVIPFSFFLSAVMLFVSSRILDDVNNFIALCTVLVIILIGILFDIIGIAVTAADETPFHAMASRKVYGARQSIRLIRNANKVSSFCNDVIGDICGVISGTASALIAVRLSLGAGVLEKAFIGVAISGMVASLTVGGKAVGKTLAIQKSNYIVYKVSMTMEFVHGRFHSGKNKGSKKDSKKRMKTIHNKEK